MRLRPIGLALAAVVVLASAVGWYVVRLRHDHTSPVPSSHLDRIVIIVLENYRADKVDPSQIEPEQFTPFLNKLARENRLATNYFGVWKPSLPNYLAMIAGDFFGVSDDHESCFSPDHQDCHGFDVPNLVDQLEKAHIAWEGLFESMPSAGFLGTKFPEDPKLYAQKHNPFVYFK